MAVSFRHVKLKWKDKTSQSIAKKKMSSTAYWQTYAGGTQVPHAVAQTSFSGTGVKKKSFTGRIGMAFACGAKRMGLFARAWHLLPL